MAKREKVLLPLISLSFCFGLALLVREMNTSFCNTNYGFGFFEPKPFLLFLELGTLSLLVWIYCKRTTWAEGIIFSILLGAGFSNALERLLYGCVADFLRLPIIGSQINIADILITLTLGILFFRQFTKPIFK